MIYPGDYNMSFHVDFSICWLIGSSQNDLKYDRPKNKLQGESKRTGPYEKKILKIDVDMIFEKLVSGIYGWVSVLIL